MSRADRPVRLPQLLRRTLLVGVCAGLLLPAAITLAGPVLQSASAGTPVVSPGGAVLPSRAHACPMSTERVAERALTATLTSYCLPARVSSEELGRWMSQHVPPDRPDRGNPFCDRQVLSDGARLYRWGTTTTFGFIRSDPNAPSAWLILVDHATSC